MKQGLWKVHHCVCLGTSLITSPASWPCYVQKSVRRGMEVEARKLAFALLESSPSDLLRRAPVICIEDCTLHPLLPAVVWLMVAHSKGLQLSLDHKGLVISFVGDLARCQLHDVGLPLPGCPAGACPLRRQAGLVFIHCLDKFSEDASAKWNELLTCCLGARSARTACKRCSSLQRPGSSLEAQCKSHVRPCPGLGVGNQ
jgi:hypothetical protein